MSRRTNALIPLSWDHHHGLDLARTVRATLAGDERLAAPSLEALRALVAARWEAELAGHFADEEAVLGPLGAQSEALEGLLARMRTEHAAIRALVGAVAASEGDDTEALARFADALTAHIRFEEQALFEAVERHLGEAAERALGEALVTRRLEDGRGSEREVKAVRGELLK